MSIVCRSAAEIEKLAKVNALVARVLKELAAAVKPGMTTKQLDEIAEQRLREAGAEPAFKGYHGYPATICASVNEQVVHGIPNDRPMIDYYSARPTFRRIDGLQTPEQVREALVSAVASALGLQASQLQSMVAKKLGVQAS